ncbi:MAG: DUF1501 domain-containing protein [Planctomycetes bacterium]|nr:DUF1501 domain-containing protein [Planctomycetota bacterium]
MAILTISTESSETGRNEFSRRKFLGRSSLSIGAIGAVGLPFLLAARAAAQKRGAQPRNTSVVWLWLQGGASPIETFDPKMSAPREYRSTSGEIPTTLPGVTFGSHFPKLAALTDRLAVVRTFSHTQINHQAGTHYVMTGYDNGVVDNSLGPQTRPAFGAITSYARGALNPTNGVPIYISLIPENKIRIEHEGPAFLGAANRAFHPFVESFGSMKLRVPAERLSDRRALLAGLDRLSRDLDASGQIDGLEAFRKQALNLVLGGARKAFDLQNEDPQVVERYGKGFGERMLLARRLCEAGCGFVTIKEGTWDFHGLSNNGTIVDGMNRKGPELDQVVSTFIEDIYARNLQDDILLVITGDFGRTPKINREGGRDHWPQVSTLAFSGGGLRMGQVIGESDTKAAFPTSEAFHPQDLMATLFHVLGIDLDLQALDYSGRPVFLIETGKPIKPLV